MHELTQQFRNLVASVSNEAVTPVAHPTLDSPLDTASRNILKLAQTCILELNKLTPAILRSNQAVSLKFRGWITGLLSDAALPGFVLPLQMDFSSQQQRLPPTSSEIDFDIQSVKAILSTMGGCVSALEAQFQKEVLRGSQSRSKAHMREQRVMILDTLKALKADMGDIISDLELRTLSWQVSVKQVFNPTLFSSGRIEEHAAAVASTFQRIQELNAEPSDFPPIMTDDEEVNELVQRSIDKLERLLEEASEKELEVDAKALVPDTDAKAVMKDRKTQEGLPSKQLLTHPTKDSITQNDPVGETAAEAIVTQVLEQSDQQEETMVLSISSKVARISELMQTFAVKVTEQQDLTENILNATEYAIESMQKASRELDKTLARKWGYRTYLFMFYIWSGVILLFLDLITSWRTY